MTRETAQRVLKRVKLEYLQMWYFKTEWKEEYPVKGCEIIGIKMEKLINPCLQHTKISSADCLNI
jgi:hypothetical protein